MLNIRVAICILGAALAPNAVSAQAKLPDVTGKWAVDANTDVKNGPREVNIRPDSSASWGKETVRWRLKKDKIMIALGGEWETYNIKIKDNAMTLSGGDLKKAITLKKTGPFTPLPPGGKVPKDPDGNH